VLRHPEHIQEVLVTRAHEFEKPRRGPTALRLRQLLGEGLLNSNGELWRKQRRLIQPAFRKERLAEYAQMIVEATERKLDGYRVGQELDLSREMMELTLRIVSRALFDHAITGEADQLAEAMRVFRAAFRSADVLLPDWLPTPSKARTKKALSALHHMIEQLLDAPRPERGLDLLSSLARSDGDEQAMSRAQLKDELLTLFIAGHETTAHALSWTWHLLSCHPEVEERVYQEVTRVIGSEPVSIRQLERLTYTEQVLSEALRLYPPAYVIPRVARVDTRIGRYAVRRDAQVLIWIYHVHHDARWFPEPERFDPERFSPAKRRAIEPGAYLPFGSGTRTCIGKQFAIIEAMLILACTVRRFRLEKLRPSVARDMALTLAPKGRLAMRVQGRTP
jgi:cytochrome P450